MNLTYYICLSLGKKLWLSWHLHSENRSFKYEVKVKIKVKVTLEEATKAQRWEEL